MGTKVEREAVGTTWCRVPFDLFCFPVAIEPDMLAPYKLAVNWKREEKNPRIEFYNVDPVNPFVSAPLMEKRRNAPLGKPNFVSKEALALDGMRIRFELSFCAVTDAAGVDCVFNYPPQGESTRENWTFVQATLRVSLECWLRPCDWTDIANFRLLSKQSPIAYHREDEPPNWAG
jgi:hypothetical protein